MRSWVVLLGLAALVACAYSQADAGQLKVEQDMKNTKKLDAQTDNGHKGKHHRGKAHAAGPEEPAQNKRMDADAEGPGESAEKKHHRGNGKHHKHAAGGGPPEPAQNKRMDGEADEPKRPRPPHPKPEGDEHHKRMSAIIRNKRDNDESDVITDVLPATLSVDPACPGKYKDFVDALKGDKEAQATYKIKSEKQLFHSMCLLPQANANLKTTTASEKAQILKLHNEQRAQEEATNMFKLTWDDDLERTAAGWVSQCTWSHDSNANRDSPGRYAVGQNLAWVDKDHPKDWAWVMKFWHEEKEFFKFGVGSTNGKMVGHYTQIVAADSYKVGCAFSDCGDEGFFWGCDYGAAGNVGGFKTPFEQGAKGSKCGDFKDADGLCDCEKADGNKDCLPYQKKDSATCSCVEAWEGAEALFNKNFDCPSLGQCDSPDDFWVCEDDNSDLCCCTGDAKSVKTGPNQTCSWKMGGGTHTCIDEDGMSNIIEESSGKRRKRR